MIFRNLLIISYFIFSTVQAGQGLSLESYNVNTIEDLSGCFQLKPYELKEQNSTSSRQHFISDFDIQKGCALKGLDLAKKKSSDKAALLQIGEEIRKGYRIEGTLDVYQILVKNDKNKESCSNVQVYSAMTAGLSHPKDYPSEAFSDVKKALVIVGLCLESKTFKQDILDEVATKKPYITDNLCPFLKSKKLLTNCPL